MPDDPRSSSAPLPTHLAAGMFSLGLTMPLQDMLAGEIAEMEANTDPKGGRERLLRSNKARRDAGKLFLCINGSGNRRAAGYHADALSNAGSGVAFRRIAKAAGTDWDLLPHQCRRTYARCIVESRMGRASLVFLKWQFKQSELLAIDDAGPAVRQRAERDVHWARQVMVDLGILPLVPEP